MCSKHCPFHQQRTICQNERISPKAKRFHGLELFGGNHSSCSFATKTFLLFVTFTSLRKCRSLTLISPFSLPTTSQSSLGEQLTENTLIPILLRQPFNWKSKNLPANQIRTFVQKSIQPFYESPNTLRCCIIEFLICFNKREEGHLLVSSQKVGLNIPNDHVYPIKKHAYSANHIECLIRERSNTWENI